MQKSRHITSLFKIPSWLPITYRRNPKHFRSQRYDPVPAYLSSHTVNHRPP